MKYPRNVWRPRLLLSIIVCGLVVIWLCLVLRESDSGPDDAPSKSIAESKAMGRYQTSVTVTPATLEMAGCKIGFDEIWIERGMKRQRNALGIVHDVPVGRYFLCFTLQQGRECLNHLEHFFFVLDDRGEGFASGNGTEIFWTRLSKTEEAHARIYLLTSWKGSRSGPVEIRPTD